MRRRHMQVIGGRPGGPPGYPFTVEFEWTGRPPAVGQEVQVEFHVHHGPYRPKVLIFEVCMDAPEIKDPYWAQDPLGGYRPDPRPEGTARAWVPDGLEYRRATEGIGYGAVGRATPEAIEAERRSQRKRRMAQPYSIGWEVGRE